MRLKHGTVMPILFCSSVLPVVGVRPGATGPGLRVRATPCLGSIFRLHEPKPEVRSFNLVIRLSIFSLGSRCSAGLFCFLFAIRMLTMRNLNMIQLFPLPCVLSLPANY